MHKSQCPIYQIHSWKKFSFPQGFLPSLLLVDDDHAVRLHLPQQHLAPLVGLGAVVLGGRGVAAVEQGSRVALWISQSVKCCILQENIFN